MIRISNPRDAAAGAFLVGIGAFFAYSGRNLKFYGEGQMGPGYLPMVLCGLLVILGIVVFVESLKVAREEIGPVPWRGIGLITAAVVGFGVSVKPLGLGLAIAIAVFLSSLASSRWRALPSLLVTGGMVLLGWAVFIRGLHLPVRMLGTWFQ